MKEYSCSQCGMKFKRYPSWAKGKKVFCSRKCQGLAYREDRIGEKNSCWRGGMREQICPICKKKFKTYYATFCSLMCKGIFLSGSNNPSWCGGLSKNPEDVSHEAQRRRKLIKKLDNFQCAFCGSSSHLHTHHINYNKNDHSLTNMITMCRVCHSKTNYNREFWTEALGIIASLRRFWI